MASVQGASQILDALSALGRAAARELCVVLPRRPYDRRVQEHLVELTAQLTGRGVEVRVICVSEAGREPAYGDHVRRLARAGARIRTVADVPLWAAVADGRYAIAPADPAGRGTETVLLRGTASVAAYAALFEALWLQGAAYIGGSVRGAGGEGPDEREREALLLLAEGLTDDGIARRTGLSIRTNRRTIAKLMDRLGARSRFQAGVEAARREWV
uniref:LuxR C-terminal-related transcriptional regulator n=1 Tax=Streptomyces sp. NBC_00049 TaxID=2903617 RepID=A0AAU2JSP3_9ACTN